MKIVVLLSRVLLVGIILSSQTAFAQTSLDAATAAAGTSNEANVKAIKMWYAAWMNRDWNLLQQAVADGFTFSSPLDDHLDIAKVKERCWPNAGNIKRVDVDEFVINGDNAVLITNGYNKDGKLFRNCDCFKLKDGKITAYECFFGPGINFPNSGK